MLKFILIATTVFIRVPSSRSILEKSKIKPIGNYDNIYKQIESTPLNEYLRVQPTFGLFIKKEKVKVVDVISVIARFKKRTDFYKGDGYQRPKSGLLTKELFFENLQAIKGPFICPVDSQKQMYGSQQNSKFDLKAVIRELSMLPPTQVHKWSRIFYDETQLIELSKGWS